MKILILKPGSSKSGTAAKIDRIERIAAQLGHRIIEQVFDGSLYGRVIEEKPDEVFNLASVYDWDKTSYIPAILEIAGARYTGSGFLTLSLARNPTRLLPMLENSGIPVPPYRIVRADDRLSDQNLRFPLEICRNGFRQRIPAVDPAELSNALNSLPLQEEVALCEKRNPGARIYILDLKTIPRSLDGVLQQLALSAYHLVEARGLTRFDFSRAENPQLTGIDVAPDPLDKDFLKSAAAAGLDETSIIRSLIELAGKD